MTKLPMIPALLSVALTGCPPVYTPGSASATDAEVDTTGDDVSHDTTSTGGHSPDVDKRPAPTAMSTGGTAPPATTATPEVSTSAAGGTESGSGSTSGDATSTTTADAPATTTAADSTTGTATTVTTTTDDSTTGTDTTAEDADKYGKCGWHSEKFYYACEKDGGTPGEVAPNNFKPIDCPMNLVAGNDCTEEMGPITNVGCCMPDGVLLYCEIVEMNKIVQIDCEK
ncbi:hypothetical protein [Nannocystis punicea]|uniref:Uncharacterized protein n=1 Tax=Nannocystis punicea TaxID=2995304 RepID=A0ABY7H6E9_9BACT|nr:hypothetical protein [Nannocystis poenicansa]WAS94845.1 hypothetical protein O0S08_01680 [Nannocystis poenicansa]